MSVDFAIEVASDTGLPKTGVAAALTLLAEDATIPFIARYRKEFTGSLDEVQLAQIRDRHDYLVKLAERKSTILKTIAEQGKLTDELREQIESAPDAARLEDLYLPYKPKRKTRATVAISQGLEPLADLIWAQQPIDGDLDQIAQEYVNEEKGVANVEAAWAGARDIVAGRISENADTRQAVRGLMLKEGEVVSKVAKGREKQGAKFRDYFDFSEPAAKIPSHRILAIRRGDSERHLTYEIVVDRERALDIIKKFAIRGDGGPLAEHLHLACEDAYDRLMKRSLEAGVRNKLREKADHEAIHVFAANMRKLLMAPPLGPKWTLGLDPGIRTGVKMVALDGKGDLLASTVVYPIKGKQDREEAAATVQRYCEHYRVEAIAVGNGTGGRETEAFLRGLDRDSLNDAVVVLVNESGASVYSASSVARGEFPDLDVTMRGAVSIGRRLQDPLSELVKIDPKAIGVGQYQHDVNQDDLKQALDETVQSCVNAVGVDLNTASPQLLQYVAGLNASTAQAIVDHRAKNGPFASRTQLLDVPRVGPKTFIQCAGFLRIRTSENPLDASAVHPERYELVEQIARDANTDIPALMEDTELRKQVDLERYVGDDVGLPTLKDIMTELARPGRDPRDKFDPVRFAPGVTEIAHLEDGMILEGVVTNVTDFGAFVDVGVHQDGLVHLSELAWRYVDDATKVIEVGQKVKVKVVAVDMDRKRISLSIKQTVEAPPKPERPPREQRPPRDRQGQGGGRQGDRPRPFKGDRGERGRDERKSGGKRDSDKGRRHESPFAGLFMEGDKIKMKPDPDKKKK
ncbi:MAG: Tex family protein [Candidatus Lernaella stagnicola]|nr:Tex family protein [Candidatus Lernaella stagnicola]